MASTLSSNPVATTSDRPASRIQQQQRKKKKKLQTKQDQTQLQLQHNSHTKWKSEAQQHLYSSKLLHALNHVDPSSSSSSSSSTCPPPPRRSRAVREAADRVLAAAAKGRTRWSRGILTSRLKLKFRHHRKNQSSAAASAATGKLKKQKFSVLRLKGKGLPAVQRKVRVRVLGRLVPGCRKQPLPVRMEVWRVRMLERRGCQREEEGGAEDEGEERRGSLGSSWMKSEWGCVNRILRCVNISTPSLMETIVVLVPEVVVKLPMMLLETM